MANSTQSQVGRLIKIGLFGGLTVGLTLISWAAGGAATLPVTALGTPAITVAPSTGLQDGQTVTVSGSGLQAGDVYHVGECAAVGAMSYACAPTNVNVTADANGTISTPMTVLRTFTGTASDGSIWPVDCTVSSCVVGVYNDAFAGGSVPISFAAATTRR